MSLKNLDNLILKNLFEASTMAGGAVEGVASPKEDEEQLSEEDEKVEEQIRKYIRSKLKKIIFEHNKIKAKEEVALRMAIRELLKEGDISDIHPHRSTGINVLEDLLKKMIPTIRTDFKKLTTGEDQRKSFRAHFIRGIKSSLMPTMVNDGDFSDKAPDFGGAGDSMLMDEPEEELAEELQMLDELDVDVDIGDEAATQPGDENMKIPIEDDDTPSEEEEFGSGLEDLDETGRNMAFTSFKKVQQYILDAYDSLANAEDKETFFEYLITNTKLYFDKFEDELQQTVEEPTTDSYEQAKQSM